MPPKVPGHVHGVRGGCHQPQWDPGLRVGGLLFYMEVGGCHQKQGEQKVVMKDNSGCGNNNIQTRGWDRRREVGETEE